jgi:hypothetical protein
MFRLLRGHIKAIKLTGWDEDQWLCFTDPSVAMLFTVYCLLTEIGYGFGTGTGWRNFDDEWMKGRNF